MPVRTGPKSETTDMKPAHRTDAELLALAAQIIRREQEAKTHGNVVISLKDGQIMSVKTERIERLS